MQKELRGGIVVFWDSRVLQLISRRAGFLFPAYSKLLKIVFNGSLQASTTQQMVEPGFCCGMN